MAFNVRRRYQRIQVSCSLFTPRQRSWGGRVSQVPVHCVVLTMSYGPTIFFCGHSVIIFLLCSVLYRLSPLHCERQRGNSKPNIFVLACFQKKQHDATFIRVRMFFIRPRWWPPNSPSTPPPNPPLSRFLVHLISPLRCIIRLPSSACFCRFILSNCGISARFSWTGRI